MDLVAEVVQRIILGAIAKRTGWGAGLRGGLGPGPPRARAIAPFNSSIRRNCHCAIRGLPAPPKFTFGGRRDAFPPYGPESDLAHLVEELGLSGRRGHGNLRWTKNVQLINLIYYF